MGNAYNHHHQQSFYNKTTFLPLLCRRSIKDVKLRESKDRSASLSDDPSSPKIGCMGQVKKNKRASAPAITSKTSYFKYAKLKRLFSGKNLVTNASATTTTTINNNNNAYGGRSWSCREIIMRRIGSRRSSKINNDDGGHHSYQSNGNNHVDVKISELDPPLPVIKKVQQPSEVNLWKRRSGGLALKNLQIEQIHHVPKNNYMPATTV